MAWKGHGFRWRADLPGVRADLADVDQPVPRGQPHHHPEGHHRHRGRQRQVDLTLSYDTLIKAGANQCTLTGTVALSSRAPRNSAVRRWEELGSGDGPVRGGEHHLHRTRGDRQLPAAQRRLRPVQGHGLVPDRDHDPAAGARPAGGQKQTATVKVPKKVKRKGKTVLLKKAVVTNAGQKATAKVTWSTKKKAREPRLKYASVKTTKTGKVTLRTTGKAKKLYVKLSPEGPGHDRLRGLLVHRRSGR